MVPRRAAAGPRARAGGQCRQFQRLHRQPRPRGGRGDRGARGARMLGCQPSDVFVASTGVIGVPLPHRQGRGRASTPRCRRRNRATGRMPPRRSAPPTPSPRARWRPPIVDGRTVTSPAIIKGSGMIAPDMATMLGFVFTDAAVEPAFLQAAAVRGQRRELLVHHGRQRHLDQRHRARLRDRQGGQCAARHRSTMPAPTPFAPRSPIVCLPARPSGRARRRGRVQVHRDRR